MRGRELQAKRSARVPTQRDPLCCGTRRLYRGLLTIAVLASSAGIAAIVGCFNLAGLAGAVDKRTEDDIDGDGVPNDIDADMDGDGLPNERDPDADSDGRFDLAMIIDFPFDHNALIKPLLPPNHPDIDFKGRVIMPPGHIDVTDIIRVNLPEHPMEVFEPRRQAEIAAESASTSPSPE